MKKFILLYVALFFFSGFAMPQKAEYKSNSTFSNNSYTSKAAATPTNTQYQSQPTYNNNNQQYSSPVSGINQQNTISYDKNKAHQSGRSSRISYYKTISHTNTNRNVFKYLFPLKSKPIKTSATFNERLTDTVVTKIPEASHNPTFYNIRIIPPQKSIENNNNLKEGISPVRYFRCLYGSSYFYASAGAYGVYVASSPDLSIQTKMMNYLSRKYKVKAFVIEEFASAKKYHLVLGRFRQLKMAFITEGKVRKEIPKAFVIKWKAHWSLI